MIIYTVYDVSALLWTCSHEQYLCASVCYANITSRVTFFGEFAGKELAEFGAEDTVCDKFALFADLGGHLESYNNKSV